MLLLSLTGAVPLEVMAARIIQYHRGRRHRIAGVLAMAHLGKTPGRRGICREVDAFRVYFQAVRDGLLAVPSKIDRDRARPAGWRGPCWRSRRLSARSAPRRSRFGPSLMIPISRFITSQPPRYYDRTAANFADHSALLGSPEHIGQPYALLNTEADRLTNSVNTLSEVVFRWSVPTGPA